MGLTEWLKRKGCHHRKITEQDIESLSEFDPERILAQALIQAKIDLYPGEEIYRPNEKFETKSGDNRGNKKQECTLPDFRAILPGPDGRDQVVHIEVGWNTNSKHKRNQRDVARAAGIKYLQIDANTADALGRVPPDQTRLFLMNILFATSKSE